LRVYLYKIPQMSGVEVSAGVTSALATRYGRIIAGVKDSSGDEAALVELCKQFGPSLDVLAGSEQLLAAAMRSGASGCVSATANAYAEWIVELYAKPDDAALHAGVVEARKVFERYPLIAALKAFEARRAGEVRWRTVLPPLQPLTRNRENQLFAEFDQLALAARPARK
jgi:4-hydroxy-tetrahydrodipicolinate synthase